jgi:adenylate kinase
MKQVILITGTPCTGKTTTAKNLARKLDALYINLTDFANERRLTTGEDKTRKTLIINETEMRKKLTETINSTENSTVIIDGHYAAAVVPKRCVTRIFVLRRNPIELRKLMEMKGYQDTKLWENLASEILDVSLVEALQQHGEDKVCELDATGKTVEAVITEILTVINKNRKCTIGKVDWIGMLETRGLTNEYLKF